MKVELIDYQENALEILLYSKSTRIGGATCLQDVIEWPYYKKIEHLEYMRHTIKSSWEFAYYIFEIKDVSRNFTHQLVRTRTQSYAQESMRTVDVRSNGVYGMDKGNVDYDNAVQYSIDKYVEMVDNGVPVQVARGVLPTDMLTSILVKTDLRTMHETAKTRLCYRTQGEYQEVFREMKECIIEVQPWADNFINVACVDSGICCFPNYTECPIQHLTVKVPDWKKDGIKEEWERIEFTATPVAEDGKTM